jgi:hypothetical protein
VLRVLVETLVQTPGAGSAFAPVLVSEPPRAAGDAVYAVMQNALYSSRAAYAAGRSRQLPFIMGQLMVFTRHALAAIGGVEAADGQLVDDMYLGRRLHEVGLRNIMSTHPLHIHIGGMTLRGFLPLYRKWMMFSRNGLPLSFTWPQWLLGGAFFVALGGLAIGLDIAAWRAVALAAVALLGLDGGLLHVHRRYGGAPIPVRFAWAPWAVFALAPVVMVDLLLRNRVEWRGREYVVDRTAASLAPGAPPSSNAA